MLLKDVRDWLDHIGSSLGDYEVAIQQVRTFYVEVLTAIATGQCKDAPPEDFAAEAVRAEKILRGSE